MSQLTERGLVDHALNALRELLGAGWTIEELADQPGGPMAADAGIDALLQLRPPDQGVTAQLVVDARVDLSPSQVIETVTRLNAVLQLTNSYQRLLVVAPWLSPATRQQLSDSGISYLDLTGNVSIRIDRPTVRIEMQGATRRPDRPRGSKRSVTLAGPRAGRLVRFMVDFEPPYRPTRLAELSGVNLPWVSRLLGQMEDQLLVRRDGRMVTEVRWEELLRARAQSYELLRANSHVGMVAPNGIPDILRKLAEMTAVEDVAITGPFAARTVAPLTAGGQLMIYVKAGPHEPDELASRLGLLPVDEGADVLVLRAHDDVVFERAEVDDGIRRVALSQVVLDGLSGPGRMPAEAEAVLGYMREHVTRWRGAVPKSV